MSERPPFSIPSWAPLAVVVALLVWAVSIWWMVATLPASASDSTDLGTVEEGVSLLSTDLDTLAEQVATLTAEVATLTEERDTLSARLDALEAAASAAPVSADSEASEAVDTEDAEASAFFTDGQDRYNCRSFTSYEDAQEALRVNGPGDPNKIDMNKNGLACEDIPFPATATPTPAATPRP